MIPPPCLSQRHYRDRRMRKSLRARRVGETLSHRFHPPRVRLRRTQAGGG